MIYLGLNILLFIYLPRLHHYASQRLTRNAGIKNISPSEGILDLVFILFYHLRAREHIRALGLFGLFFGWICVFCVVVGFHNATHSCPSFDTKHRLVTLPLLYLEKKRTRALALSFPGLPWQRV
jgi:hypothetical protein